MSAVSIRPEVMSAPPSSIRSKARPWLKTMVETRERESPLARAKASATASSCSRSDFMARQYAATVPYKSTANLPLPQDARAATMPQMINPLYKRIKKRLDDLGMSDRAASMKAVGNPDLIRNIKRLRSESPRPEGLKQLARVLETNVSWLIGEVEHVPSEDVLNDAHFYDPKFNVKVVGVVQAGNFIPVDLANQGAGEETVVLHRVAGYDNMQQYAWEVRGDSMNLVKIHEGMYVIGADYHDFVRARGPVRDGRLVIVRRTRFSGHEIELTIKELHIAGDQRWLVPRSSNPAHKPIPYPANGALDNGETVEIIAVVLSAAWDFKP